MTEREGKPWTFIYAADPQPGSPRSFRFNPAWAENWEIARRQIAARRPEFLLVGGDLTRDGSIHRWELEQAKADLDGLGIPCHVIPGNMDTGNKHAKRQGPFPERDDLALNITPAQLEQFESVFGPSRWTFTHRNVRVSGFCDMLLGSGLPEERELWTWLEEQAVRPRIAHDIWLTHYPLFLDAPDEPPFDMSDPARYYDWYFCLDQGARDRLLAFLGKGGATRVISGHVHCRKDHCAAGIRFDLAPATAMPQWGERWPDGDDTLGFFEFAVRGREMEKRFIPLERVSTRTDAYGPGGHPRPEARDYSLAREK